MTSLLAALPSPRYSNPTSGPSKPSATASSSLTTTGTASSSTTLATRPSVPAYGQRSSFRPTREDDFADGGAYPECHLAQYPRDLGRKKKTTNGNTLTLQVDENGDVRYDAIAQQGHRSGTLVQSQFKDLVPLLHRADLSDASRSLERPSQADVQSTTDRTKAALEKLLSGKIKTAKPDNVESTAGDVAYIRYTPGQGKGSDGSKQRIIQMTQLVEDPLEPPKHKGKKIPRGPPSPPPPILRSPPRKLTSQEQKDWLIPPCVSNWKNNNGFTIPLDKRLAADGRGLQDVLINDRFAQFSESLYIADRHAREEVRQRSLMQQRIAEKEKESKEQSLRALAQRARDERSGIVAPASNAPAMGGGMGLGDYGSDSEDEGSPARVQNGEAEDEDEDEDEEREGDVEGARERAQIRSERKKEREREMRMSNMGTEQRAKILARATGRDISEKIALGLAKPTLSSASMLDSRLFNQEELPTSFGADDSYSLYSKPLFSGSSAAAAIYKPRGANVDDEGVEMKQGGEEAVREGMRNDRFGLGRAGAGRGFEGADTDEIRDGPVAFEKDTPLDPFGVDAFLDEAKKGGAAGGNKRGLTLPEEDGRGKRSRD